MLPPLYQHQVDTIDRALACHGSLAIFHEPGLGKTRTALEIYTRLKQATPTLKMLVVAPLSVCEAVWGEEIGTMFTWTMAKHLNPVADIVIVNFESLIRPTTQHRLAYLWHTPLLLIVDESSRMKSHTSLTTKTLLAIAERCQYRLILSGTPAPNSLHELHGQMRVVAPELFPKSFYQWRREWFYLERNGRMLTDLPPSRGAMQQLFQSGWKFQITPQKREQLLALCAPITSWVRKIDAVDLPEKITTVRHVVLSPEELRAYEQMRRELVVEFEQEVITAEIALTRIQKLQQITNGFLYGEDTTHQIGTSRLTVLLEILEELGNQPVVIWASYRNSIEQIAHALGEKAVTLYGGTKDRLDSLRRFGIDAQYLIAHPLSAGHGLTLTQSSSAVYYSLGWSYEQYIQSQDRQHRIGTKHSVLYTHLIAPKTVDEDVLQVLQKKRSLQEVIDGYLGKRRP